MAGEAWYALFRETRSFTPGAVWLDFDRDIRAELTERGFSPEDCRRRDETFGTFTEETAWAYFRQHQDRVSLYPNAERYRKARAQRGRCWYCGRVLNLTTVGQDDSAELEHQTPRHRRLPVCSLDRNKVTSCRDCNNPAGDGKGNRDLEEYRAHLLARRFPERVHLFFFGEWLAVLDSGAWTRDGLERVAHQTFGHPHRALAFPAALLAEYSLPLVGPA